MLELAPIVARPGTEIRSGAVHFFQDSIQVESPLPGGVATIVRFIFNQPQWLQIGVAALGLLAGLALLAFIWTRRVPLLAWLRTRSRAVTLALALGGVLAIAGAAAGGAASWHYTQHDNGFCVGCHVMNPAYARFTQSQHSRLECHDCHQQPITASIRQLYLWVAERPAEIGPHAKVPNTVCANCHITNQRENWQRIAATAGHRVHLESDSSVLRDLQCVTCHGVEVHQFQPAAKTCGQAGCHPSVGITVGKMQAAATTLHCVACHQFTAEVPALATRDSAAGTLVPGEQQCMACHRTIPSTASFNSARDPHNGSCGMCHNPHSQRVAADAARTCASAACHSDWRKEPFHNGVRHRDVANQCTLCHRPHEARVDASDCAGCHETVSGRTVRSRRVTPPLPFDTTEVLQRGPFVPPDDEPRGEGSMPPPRNVSGVAPSEVRAPPDTFPHARHTSLACVTCHLSERDHGRLSFEPPRGCQICHHQPARSDCVTCHRKADLAEPLARTIQIAVRGGVGRDRSASFRHERHDAVKCTVCHTTSVSLASEPPVATCTSCHTSHHAARQDCSQCHSGSEPAAAHRPALATHTGCNRCHRPEVVAELVPTRSLCLACHQSLREHFPAGECTTCHFQATPEAFRSHLSLLGRTP